MDIFLDNHVSMKIKRGGPVRRNIQKQKVTNAPIVKPQGEVINAKFKVALRILWQVGQQRGFRQEGADASRIHEFLWINQQSFTSLSTTEYLENFTEELKGV